MVGQVLVLCDGRILQAASREKLAQANSDQTGYVVAVNCNARQLG